MGKYLRFELRSESKKVYRFLVIDYGHVYLCVYVCIDAEEIPRFKKTSLG